MTKNLKNSSTNSRSRGAFLRRHAKVGGYLAASVGTTVLGTAPSEAAIIDIDLGPSGFDMLGVNGGIASNTVQFITDFPVAGGINFQIQNSPSAGAFGLFGGSGIFSGGSAYATPTNFAQNAPIGPATFTPAQQGFSSLFYYFGYASPDFGPASFMGFRFPNGGDFSYGWLEVTWTASSSEFEILSASYESDPGVAINAGARAVPEPTTMTLTGIAALGLGAGAIRRSRKARTTAANGAGATVI